ncbi:MAG: flagellar hook-length control protein FliK [Alphaproteobacteria bacterium]|nr:flagellar hook-length control protein FliK [Alphaproteobacteria bacterium]
MVDLTLFATQLIHTDNKVNASHNALFAKAGIAEGEEVKTLDPASRQTQRFIDNIINKLVSEDISKESNENLAGKKEAILPETALFSDEAAANDKITSEKLDLELLKLALMGQDPNQSLEDKISNLAIENVTKRLNNRAESLEKFIQFLTSGLPEGRHSEQSVKHLIDNLQKRLEKLEAKLDSLRSGDIDSPDSPFQVLIATGLNPSQLTDITSRIEEVETKLGRELTLEDIIAGVGNIIPFQKNDPDNAEEFGAVEAYALISEIVLKPEQQKEAIQNLTKETLDTDTNAGTNDAVNSSDSDFLEISNLVSRAHHHNSPKDSSTDLPLEKAELTPAQNLSTPPRFSEEESLHATLTHMLHHANIVGRDGVQINQGPSQNIAQKTGHALSTLKNNTQAAAAHATPLANIPAQTGALSSNDIDALAAFNFDSLDFSGFNFDIETGLPFSQTGQAAHLTTLSTHHAGHTHPATQMVSAKLSKAVKQGGDQQMILQLDPPELGRVEIKIEFGHDKMIKAHIVAEKPETYLLLQRDASSLERTLQDSGFDTDHSSLTFDMAQEGKDFFAGKDSHSGENHASKSDTGEPEDETGTIIESTMTWNVDPATGHVRYSILA